MNGRCANCLEVGCSCGNYEPIHSSEYSEWLGSAGLEKHSINLP